MKDIRALRADEIEVRVGQVTEKGVSLLLYKDSRCDKRILDEVFGIEGWANCYSEIKGNLYCSIMIYDDKTGMWIQKQDCGVESNTEKEKGEASDAFKRAGFNVGIGRELYTKIFIFVNVPTKLKTTLSNGKKVYELADAFAKWHVADIETNMEKEKIEYLQIADSKNNIVFTYGKKAIKSVQKETTKIETKKEETVQVLSKEQLDELMNVSNGRGDVVVRVAKDNGYDNPRKIKVEDFEKIKVAIEAEIMM